MEYCVNYGHHRDPRYLLLVTLVPPRRHGPWTNGRDALDEFSRFCEEDDSTALCFGQVYFQLYTLSVTDTHSFHGF